MKSSVLLAGLLAVLARPAQAQHEAAPCCGIVSIDAATGVVTATVNADKRVFTFKVTDARTLRALRVGQGVFANFRTKQVSVDGAAPCCGITSGPAAGALAPAPATTPPAAQPARETRPVTPPAQPGGHGADARAVSTAAIPNVLPSIAYGPPHPRDPNVPAALTRFTSRSVSAQVAGRNITSNVVHLRGLKAVAEAPGLPDGARRLITMLMRRTPRTESDHYIVNTKMAQEWIAAHPVPDDVFPTEPHEKKCDNWYDSFDCAGQAVTDEWRRTYDHAVNEWHRAEERLADAWDAAQSCFTERTLSLADIPVRFDIAPTMTVNLEQSGTRGSGTGTVRGSVGLGFPIEADFEAQLDLFYIPCIPFAVRPKSLGADGTMGVAEVLTTQVSATGRFNKKFMIPPSGGPVIPIQVFPIIIGGVPVAELDVSAYIDGSIEVMADGAAEGRFQVRNSDRTRFEFACSGSGCRASSRGQPSPTTMSEGAQIEGTVSVKPAIYTALQLNFNYEALSVRAGPQPYLLGTASGCAAVAGSQTAGAGSTSSENHALTADLDWGVELRAEALMMRNLVSSPYIRRMMDDRHLWFRDLAPGGSNALVPIAESTGAAQAARPAGYRLKMPSCYPYSERVEYRVTWTGNATPAPRPGCIWQSGGGTCKLDPAKEEAISLVWPAAGTYTLTVAAVGDGHERTFAPAPQPARLSVTVQP